MTVAIENIEVETNEVIDTIVYLQLMSFLLPNTKSKDINEIINSTYKFVKNSSKFELISKLPEIKIILNQFVEQYMKEFPLKKAISQVAYEWNSFFKEGKNPLGYGINYGWLEEQMDLSKLYNYNYVPYHYKVGLYAHAGYGGVEEDVLLKDAFTTLVKTDKAFKLLNEYGLHIKKEDINNISNEEYKRISDIKFEVCSYSRLTVISFYAFVECFVNSVGYSYLLRNENILTNENKEVLKGYKKGSYLSLKSKIEQFQKIIRKDKKCKIITSDKNQIKEPFNTFFNNYEHLRNSAVHFSPMKEPIWLKPEEWVKIAKEFSELSLQVALEFWQSCYEDLNKPDYLGRFDFYKLYKLSEHRIENIEKATFKLYNEQIVAK